MAKIFVDIEQVLDKTIIINDKGDLHHLQKVLRLKKGDELDVSDGVSFEYHGRLISIDGDEAEVEILDKQAFAREPEIEVTLFQGIPKSDKMEDIIQKCVELGVHRIVPVFMERTIVTDKGNFDKKLQRWQKISDEAVKQCKRGKIPKISHAQKFGEALTELRDFQLIIFPYENEGNYTIKDCLRKYTTNNNPMKADNRPKEIAIIIGPEGGFSDKEADALKGIGAECVTLGKTILRTQTAAQTALAMTMYELEL